MIPMWAALLISWLVVTEAGRAGRGRVEPPVASLAISAEDESGLAADAPVDQKEERRPPRLGASDMAGFVGLALGYMITPSKTKALYPNTAVRTAEAWRRRIKSRVPIPLAERAPRILAISLMCSFAVDYASYLPAHGPVESIRQTRVGRLGGRVLRSPPAQRMMGPLSTLSTRLAQKIRPQMAVS
jgi:hypothetical protein